MRAFISASRRPSRGFRFSAHRPAIPNSNPPVAAGISTFRFQVFRRSSRRSVSSISQLESRADQGHPLSASDGIDEVKRSAHPGR